MAPYGPKVLTALALAPHDVVRGIHDAAVPGRPYLRQPLRAEKRSPSEAGPPIITSICFSMGPFGRAVGLGRALAKKFSSNSFASESNDEIEEGLSQWLATVVTFGIRADLVFGHGEGTPVGKGYLYVWSALNSTQR
ncbi:hypothetical protein BHE74_00013433 [Ensete ventricosum]|nr:hypothetical protein BHE74_00013433 [Ensete ventricosum]